MERLQVATGDLRRVTDPESLPFASTDDVTPVDGVMAHDQGVEALQFGVAIDGPGQNVFVRGLTGTDRLATVRRLVEASRPACPLVVDHCYVHNFRAPDRPRLITLARGLGPRFARRVDELAQFIRRDLPQTLATDAVRSRRGALDQDADRNMKLIGEPFDERLRANDLAMISVAIGETRQPVVVPLIDDQPVPPAQLTQLRSEGKMTDEEVARLSAKIEAMSAEFEDVSARLFEVQAAHQEAIRTLHEDELGGILKRRLAAITADFSSEAAKTFLQEVADDAVQNLARGEGVPPDDNRYRVNVISKRADDGSCPIIVENSPTLRTLLGGVDPVFPPSNETADHMMIRPGSLLKADGGFLIMEARDVLGETGAWKALIRTLRTGALEIVSAAQQPSWMGPVIQPEPIHIQVKIVILGDADLYYALDAHDEDFAGQFKVLADFEGFIPRDDAGVQLYAGVLARIAEEEALPAFDRTAVAALVDHGSRIAARQDRLTSRFGRIADIAREAAFLARRSDASGVRAEDVVSAIRRGKSRGDLPARRFRAHIADGTIRIQTRGEAVGQINGLAVISAGPLNYGFPCRITATMGPGMAGAINIERESQLSGAIHTKGFYILGGLLRHLLRTEHVLAFSASIAFEQNYGGIDGDSASGAEACCLLSALAEFPLRQDVAMTGAIDQFGAIQAVGAVNEKIEGFFDTCVDAGLTGTQGVLIPRANARDLMLRSDVVAACREGRFRIWAVESIHEALQILTGRDAGIRRTDGTYPSGSLLRQSMDQAEVWWRKAIARHET